MKVVSTYPGKLILPDGTEILKDQEIMLDKVAQENAAVLEWIAAGWLAKAK